MTISLQLINHVTGCDHFQALERAVWKTPDIEVVPSHVLMTILKNGGALLGAYDSNGPEETSGMVGAALWWIGTTTSLSTNTLSPNPASDVAAADAKPTLKICSHIVGVHPKWQGQNVGLRLKLEQRRLVLEQGLTDHVTWTYDPLIRPNAVFNMHRLRATSTTYYRNVYGKMEDEINKGAPSDRCQVDWHLRNPQVEKVASGERLPSAPFSYFGSQILSTQEKDGFLWPVDEELRLNNQQIAVPLPEDIMRIRQNDSGLALAWRYYMRSVLEAAFIANFVMADCIQIDERWYYVLYHTSQI